MPVPKCYSTSSNACRAPANAFPNGLALAAFLQMHSRTVWRLQSSCKCIPERFDACRAPASIKTFVFTFAERRCVFGMVGAVPVCPPERPRSGVSIPKTHALCAGMNDGCALECRRVIIICIEVPIKSARRGRLGYCLNYSFVHLAGELQWYNYNHYHHYHSYKTQ